MEKIITNYKAQESYDIIPEGDYETVIQSAEIRTTGNGKHKIGFTLTVRNDVQQNCQNRKIFLDVWRRQNPTEVDEQVGGFSYNQLMRIAKHAQLPDNKEYQNLEEFLADMVGKCLKVTVYHDTYNGSKTARVDILHGLAFSDHPDCKHATKQQKPVQPAPRFSTVSDDFQDIPF